jgi:hypothetical protein
MTGSLGIIVNDQAIHVVDSEEFRQMIISINPTLSDQDIPHRTAIHLRVDGNKHNSGVRVFWS